MMKCYSKPVVEHKEVPLADDGRLDEIVSFWQQRAQSKHAHKNDSNATVQKSNRCYVICVVTEEDSYPEGKLTEILGLVAAQGDQLVGQVICPLKKPNPKTFIGPGIVECAVRRAHELGADMLVIDAELSPSQTRNLELMAGMPICDREAVILNVFLKHAKSRRSRNQVEIAQLHYLRPRIRGLGLTMDQQAGGIMTGRGAGETASELLARQLDNRLVQLMKSSKQLTKAAVCQRKLRANCRRIALIGYTNAGKTSLMNALTSAGLSARDLPFETLDITTRILARQAGCEVLLSDTVGFIRNLPQRLVASFESTLAETLEADLLVIVTDVSDPECELHLQTTEAMLVQLQTDAIPRFYVFNKSDKLVTPVSAQQCRVWSRGYDYLLTNTHDQAAMSGLKARLTGLVKGQWIQAKLFVPYQSQHLINKIYADCRVIETQSDQDGMHFTLEAETQKLALLQAQLKEMQR